MEITYDVIMAVVGTVLFIGSGMCMAKAYFAKEDVVKIKYNVEAILCYILASGI